MVLYNMKVNEYHLVSWQSKLYDKNGKLKFEREFEYDEKVETFDTEIPSEFIYSISQKIIKNPYITCNVILMKKIFKLKQNHIQLLNIKNLIFFLLC